MPGVRERADPAWSPGALSARLCREDFTAASRDPAARGPGLIRRRLRSRGLPAQATENREGVPGSFGLCDGERSLHRYLRSPRSLVAHPTGQLPPLVLIIRADH